MQATAPILSLDIEDRIKRYFRVNDPQAISLVFEHYGLAMLNSIKVIINDGSAAEDVLQEVLVKVWKHAASYDASKGSLFTWLIRISKNAAIDKTRSREFIQSRKSNHIENFVFNDEAIHQKNKLEQENNVWESVNLLPESQRCLIEMAYFKGYTQKEISKELDIPLGTVKTRIRSALKSLRRYF